MASVTMVPPPALFGSRLGSESPAAHSSNSRAATPTPTTPIFHDTPRVASTPTAAAPIAMPIAAPPSAQPRLSKSPPPAVSPPPTAAVRTAPTAAPTAVLHTGTLTKLGTNILNKWRNRFFVLRSDSLLIFESRREWSEGKPPLGRVAVDANMRCGAEQPTDLEWRIVTPDQTIVVRSTLVEKKEWFAAIELASGRGGAAAAAVVDAGEKQAREDELSLFTAAREGGPDPLANPRRRVVSAPSTPASGPLRGSPTPEPEKQHALATRSSAPSPSASPTPLQQQARSKEQLAKAAADRAHKSRKAQSLFGWPSTERVINDFSCAVLRSIMLHGRLYITENYIGFNSVLFAGVRISVRISDIISVCEVNQAIIFPNAIKIFLRPTSSDAEADNTNDEKTSSYFFGSFAPGSRINAYTLITSLINGTFDPVQHGMRDTDRETSYSSSQVDSAYLSDSSVAECDDAAGEEDAASDEKKQPSGPSATPPPSSAPPAALDSAASVSASPDPLDQKSRLEFGEHRPPAAASAAHAQVEMKEMCVEVFPTIDAKLFWKIFMSDAALYSAEMYHHKRGDTEYAASSWTSAHLVDGAAEAGWQLVRDTMVRVPVTGAPNTNFTRVLKVQRMKEDRIPSSAAADPPLFEVTVETVAVTPEVPLGDSFHLVDRWSITDLPTGGCRLRIRLGMHVHRPTWKWHAIRPVLVPRAMGDNEKGFKLYVSEMTAWLATHTNEVDAVRRIMRKSNAAHRDNGSSKAPTSKEIADIAPAAGLSASESSSVMASPADDSTGLLSTIRQRLPPSMQSPQALLAFALVIVVALVALLPFGSSSLESPQTSDIGAAARSPADGTAGSYSWTSVVLVVLLLVAVGALARQVQELQHETRRLRAEIKKK